MLVYGICRYISNNSKVHKGTVLNNTNNESRIGLGWAVRRRLRISPVLKGFPFIIIIIKGFSTLGSLG